jgi:hypothetical protein
MIGYADGKRGRTRIAPYGLRHNSTAKADSEITEIRLLRASTSELYAPIPSHINSTQDIDGRSATALSSVENSAENSVKIDCFSPWRRKKTAKANDCKQTKRISLRSPLLNGNKICPIRFVVGKKMNGRSGGSSSVSSYSGISSGKFRNANSWTDRPSRLSTPRI